MRVLVTGGTGYLGRAVVRALAARGHAPVVFARRASSAGLPGDAIDGDVRNRAALGAAAKGCDALCHGAALVSIWRRRSQDFDDVNVGGLRHAIDAARDAGVERLVYTSSFLARPPAGHGAPLAANDYQRSKTAALGVALRARDAGAPVVTLVPGVVYGPGPDTEGNLVGRLLRDHARGRLPGLVGPERIWSFTWIDDVAAVHVAAIERGRPGEPIGVGGDNVSVRRAFELARDLGAFDRLPRRLPYPLAATVGALEEARAWLTGATPLVTRGAVEIFRHDWPVECDVAARDLGHPRTPLADGLRQTLAAWRT